MEGRQPLLRLYGCIKLIFFIFNRQFLNMTTILFFLLKFFTMATGFASIKPGIKIHFNPKVGTSYKYNLTDIGEVQQIAKNKQYINHSVTQFKTTFIYKITKKVDSGYSVSIQIISDDIKIRAWNSGDKEVYNSKRSTAIVGSKFTLTLSNSGKIKNIVGYEDLENKYKKNKSNQLAQDSNSNRLPRKIVFEDMFRKVSEILPDSFVSLNSSWINNEAFQLGEDNFFNKRYSLFAIADDIAFIKTHSLIEKYVGDSKLLKVYLSGSEKGKMEVESKTAMPLVCKKNYVMNGTCKIGGIDILIKTSGKLVLKGQKI